jgi:two-component system, NarL family, response regulator LiaR
MVVTAMKKHRIILVEDQTILLESLVVSLGLEEDIQIVGNFSSAEEALVFAEKHEFDIAIVDNILPGMDGITFTRRLREMEKPVKVIILSAHTRGDMVLEAFEAGAVAYLPKEVPIRELIQCVRAVGRGDTVLSQKIARTFVKYVSSLRDSPREEPSLTAEQVMLLRFACQGLSNKEIAARLGAQEPSIKVMFHKIYKALGANDRAHAVYMAANLGIVSLES